LADGLARAASVDQRQDAVRQRFREQALVRLHERCRAEAARHRARGARRDRARRMVRRARRAGRPEMYRKALLAVTLAGAAVTAVAGPFGRKDAAEEAVRDLYFGEAVYHANQGYYFEALERLDTELGQHRAVDEPALDSLYRHLNEAEFSVGDFELNYR